MGGDRHPQLIGVNRGLLRLFTNRPGTTWRGTLDYIFVSPGVRVVECDIILDRPSPDDPTLYASDHLGLMATLEVQEKTVEGHAAIVEARPRQRVGACIGVVGLLNYTRFALPRAFRMADRSSSILFSDPPRFDGPFLRESRNMSVPSEFSRRFFADFIACLIRSRSLSEGGPRTSPGPSSAGEENAVSINTESAPEGAMVDHPGFLPGLGSSGA